MAAGDLPERVVEVPTPTPGANGKPATRIRTLSVVIPAKNESLNLPALLREVDDALRQLPQLQASEVLVIDDGSTDDTPEIGRTHGARVVTHAESLGNGAAVKRGLREARHDWILLLDGDGQHPPGELPAMAALAERFDMVVASRGGRGGSLHRNFANQVYNRLASYVSGRRIPDLTSGYRLLRADIAKDLVCLLPNTFSYPTTMTMAMLRAGFGVAFHPFQVRQRRGKSHIRLVADGSRFFLIILRIATFFAPLRVFLPVSLAVAAAGVGWYLYTWLTEGRFTNMALLLLGQATLLFALGLISEQIASLRFMRLGRGDER
ncbi:MAG: glycosyltransferase family 2 protein [Planctomycetes bacterium]|nr:glycosyltransferase family 2 protein [Planctomycetota bacterium]